MSKRSKKKRELAGSRMEDQRARIEHGSAERAIELGRLDRRQEQLEAAMFAKTGNLDYLTQIPEWKKAKIARDQAYISRLVKNGITPEDLTAEYERGRKEATKEYVDKLLPFQQKFFYSAAAIAAHDLFGFGKDRALRLLDRIQEIMCEEISTGDIIERCKRETGVDCFEEEFTI